MIPVFEASPHVAYRLQDQIAAHMMASLLGAKPVKPVRLPSPRKAPPTALKEYMGKCAAERAALAPQVRAMVVKGMTQTQIAQSMGVSRRFIMRIVSEIGVTPTVTDSGRVRQAKQQRADLAPLVARMLADGKSRVAIGKELGVNRKIVAQIIAEFGERHTERTAA